MPTSKSSTSSEQLEYTINSLTQERDYYKEKLDQLLNAVHRDGGQYTTLAGLQVSHVDALEAIPKLYRENTRLWARNKELTK